MKYFTRFLKKGVPTVFALLGLASLSNQAAAQPVPAHPGAHSPPAPESTSTSTAAIKDEDVPASDVRDVEIQSPPGMIGRNWPSPVEDQRFGFLLVDQLEYRMKDDADTVRWDAVGWYGGDYNRLWLKSEGDWRTSGERGGEAEVQALYGKLIAPFWDFQIGVRHDQFSGEGFDRSRGFAVIGVQGLSPYRFEVEPALFISEDGDVSARLAATYEVLLTQRLMLQPRLDIDAASGSAEQFGVGDGINSVGLGLRLRYEITREVAPYLGIHWLRRFGETADFARRDGEQVEETAVILGARLWF